jgi:hypothetical protein
VAGLAAEAGVAELKSHNIGMAGLDPAIHDFRRHEARRGCAGHRRAEATPFFERLCPRMTRRKRRAGSDPGLFLFVIACGKREAFAHGSKATKQSILPFTANWIASLRSQ